ncbi:MAG: hypothetical protein CME64_11725 [Halobacteriovoraceae bacterium]|nr:hypothetical protein [Halobacteriovoraceae bacterium]|tara:strand:- start:94043 stop:94606 length:564 start_codon:yes stop_codon:yes gene_type:complete
MKNLILVVMILAISTTASASNKCSDETSLLDERVQGVIISQDKIDFYALLGTDVKRETLSFLPEELRDPAHLKDVLVSYYFMDGDIYLPYGGLDAWIKKGFNRYVGVDYKFNSINKDSTIQEYRCIYKVKTPSNKSVSLQATSENCPLHRLTFERAGVDYRDNKELSFKSLSQTLGEGFEIRPVCND